MPSSPGHIPPLEALGNAAFSRVAEAKLTDGNAVKLLCDAAENYPAWLKAIAEAQHSVNLENYIIADDRAGRDFSDALIAAARRGVRCRVVYDWLGCFWLTPNSYWRRLRAGGVEVCCYNPPHLANPLAWISRDHRKMLSVDGQMAFIGGLCIGQDWLGDPPHRAPWRDTAIEIRGPAVALLDAAFDESWRTAKGLPDDTSPPPQDCPAAGELSMWVIASHPTDMGLYRLEQLIAEIVEKSLWLSDAYFVATTGYVKALTGAARAGVDVRLLVPGSNNLFVVRTLSQAGYRPLLEAGVRVFEWNGPMMHAKTAVADGCWSRIGSSNSNFTSWISNRELDVTIKDPGFAKEMEAMFERDLANATEIHLDSRQARAAGSTRPESTRQWRKAQSSRLVAGVVGLGSVLGATVTQHRALGPAEVVALSSSAGLLLLLSLAAFLWPHFLAYLLGAFSAWMGLSILLRARKLHKSGPKS